ncbi:MAG: hypothetical protein AAFY57_16340, partial [Cyanobacteria bacterium J06642_2]
MVPAYRSFYLMGGISLLWSILLAALASWILFFQWQGHTDWVRGVALTEDGRAVSASDDSTLRVWDLDSGETLQTLTGHTGPVLGVALTEDGRAVSASDDSTLRVWDLD